jgi:taurine dioxygenase
MELDTEKVAEHVGIEVKGLDASKPFDKETFAALYKAWADNSVLVLRGQEHLTPEQFVQFARQFGKPIEQTLSDMNIENCPELAYVSSEDRDVHGTGKRIVRGTSWHTDHSYADVPPKATMLFGIDIPAEGGDTQFASTAAAYDALPAEMRAKLDDKLSVHAYESSRSPRPMPKRADRDAERHPGGATHPLIRTNPDSGRRSIFVNTVRSECILDMPREESNETLDRLYVHIGQEKFQYRHKWQKGDIVVWDNRSILHKANGDYEGKRFLYRIMIEGEKPA